MIDLHAKSRSKLKEYSKPLIQAAYLTLSNQLREHPAVFYEYVMLCRDPDYTLYVGELMLENEALMVDMNDGRFRVNGTMRELTLALTNDKEFLELALVPPAL